MVAVPIKGRASPPSSFSSVLCFLFSRSWISFLRPPVLLVSIHPSLGPACERAPPERLELRELG